MAFEFTISQSVLNESRSVSNSNVFTGAAKTSVSEVLASDTANELVDFAVVVEDVKAFYMVASSDVLVEPNSASSPDDPITLIAGVPYVWHENSYDAFHFGTDIEQLYVTKLLPTDGEDITFQIECLYDPTP